jgi:hypothetical protein
MQVLFHALKLPSAAGGEAGQVKLVKTITIQGKDWRVSREYPYSYINSHPMRYRYLTVNTVTPLQKNFCPSMFLFFKFLSWKRKFLKKSEFFYFDSRFVVCFYEAFICHTERKIKRKKREVYDCVTWRGNETIKTTIKNVSLLSVFKFYG